jgi:hypothetical protein
METNRSDKRLEAEHGVVSAYPDDFFGYFGWPTLARLDDGALVAAASGLRNEHRCPFGRSVICISVDDGETWSPPRVVNDTPIDDRDAGIVSLGGDRMLISWFSTDFRKVMPDDVQNLEPYDEKRDWPAAAIGLTDETVSRFLGSWIRVSHDRGASWADPIKVDLTAPHGPIHLRSGKLLYFGKEFLTDMGGFSTGIGRIAAMESGDDGTTWERLGDVPIFDGTKEGQYHEPHVAELPDGRLLGLIRLENLRGEDILGELGLPRFSIVQTRSNDGGRTWSRAEPLGFHGSPPHLLVHSSGALICAYGRRLEPYGERIMISRDGGESWTYDLTLRDDGPDSDLGYASSVELADGRIMTMYYQKLGTTEEKCALLWSKWELPF